MDPVEQPRSPRSCTGFDLFRDKRCALQNSEVLTDRIVVQLYVLGELSDAYGSVSLGDIAKQVVGGGITESARLGPNLVTRKRWVD